MLSKTQIKVVLILLDNEGHASWELAQYLKRRASNLHPVLKNLIVRGIIEKGESRIQNREHKRNTEYTEKPYFLKMNLETIRVIVRELVETNLKDTWFIFNIIGASAYYRMLKEKFKETDDVIKEELRKSLTLSENYYMSILNQDVRFEESLPDPIKEEIRYWYNSYIKKKLLQAYELARSLNYDQ
jgi:hypothetical protein